MKTNKIVYLNGRINLYKISSINVRFYPIQYLVMVGGLNSKGEIAGQLKFITQSLAILK